jgi:hypothetical protein
MLRFDDQFPLHRKVGTLSDSAFRMHVEAIFWCARNLTDGFVKSEELHAATGMRKPDGNLAQVTARGAWHRIKDGAITDCAECQDRYGNTLMGDGWLIHGFLDWQQPRSKVLQIRQSRQAAGKLGGLRSGEVRKSFASRKDAGLLRGKRSAKPQATTPAKATGKQNANQVASNDDEPPIPSPSKEGNRGSPPADAGRAGRPSKPAPSVAGVPPPAPNGRSPNRAKAIAQARAVAANSRRAKPSLLHPFLPPTGQDKAENALAALDAALQHPPPPGEETPP